jgi:uncharacterized lipoprotein YajG
MLRTFLLAACAVLITACAFTPQQATLAPKAYVSESSEGAGTPVTLRVNDERPTKQLGNRGSVYGKMAAITTKQDVAVVISEQLTAGLKRRGYSVQSTSREGQPDLAVELRALDYSTSTGFWTGGVQVTAAMKVRVVRGSQTYEKMYRSEHEERVVVVPTAATNEGWLNRALDELLAQFFDDAGLFTFLKSQQGTH